jgi:tRNA nucleotidyltransferase (CCA-adding enzyme)
MTTKLYKVGGAVRDALLGKTPKDTDYVLVGATYDQARAMYGESVGATFPVFIDANGNEVALARKETKAGTGHTGFVCDFSPDVTLEQDLARRDLTVNAIAMNSEGEYIDPFGGVADLKAKVLRAVGPAFAEDPLRVYRLARFAAVLGFEVEPGTAALASSLVQELGSLSGERVAAEMIKTLFNVKPSVFFRTLLSLDVLHVHFPELQALVDVPAGPEEHHQEGSAFEHTMLVLDEIECSDPVSRFGALVHDLGKGVTPKSELPKHHGHDSKVELVDALCDRLKMPAEYLRFGKLAMSQHMRAHEVKKMSTKKLVQFVHQVSKPTTDMYRLIEVVEADGRGRKPSSEDKTTGERILKVYAAIKSVKPLEVIQAAEKSRADRAARTGTKPEKLLGKHIGELIYRAEIQAVSKVLEAS